MVRVKWAWDRLLLRGREFKQRRLLTDARQVCVCKSRIVFTPNPAQANNLALNEIGLQKNGLRTLLPYAIRFSYPLDLPEAASF